MNMMDRLRQQRERNALARQEDSRQQEQMDQERLNFFNPVCHLVGQLHDAGAKFPAGRPPSLAHALNLAELSATGPRVGFSIDTRREIILETTTRDGSLMYSAYIWEISQSTNQLITRNIAEIETWLVEQVTQFEIQRPSRPTPGLQRRTRTRMPPPLSNPISVPPEEIAEDDDGDDGSEGREQRVIDLR
jgi:hypothetical protein